MGHPPIVLYTQTGCADSARVRAWLREQGLAFSERNVSKDPRAMQELADRHVFATPLIVVGEQRVLGFKPKAIKALLQQSTQPERRG
jgi:arsenate reductase-like glutaredoxin family protein